MTLKKPAKLPEMLEKTGFWDEAIVPPRRMP